MQNMKTQMKKAKNNAGIKEADEGDTLAARFVVEVKSETKRRVERKDDGAGNTRYGGDKACER